MHCLTRCSRFKAALAGEELDVLNDGDVVGTQKV